ncbi:unnamed protein product, partial [marine sediment metagenome]
MKIITHKKQVWKIALISVLVVLCCLATYYFHAVLHTGTVVTHLYYIPIILSVIWWQRRGLVVAVLLAAFLAYSHVVLCFTPLTENDFSRIFIFLTVTFAIWLASERIAEADKRTAESEINFRALAENANIGIYISDKDRQMVYVNRELCRITGYTEQELYDLAYFKKVVHPDAREYLKGRHRQRKDGIITPDSYDSTLLTSDGKPLPIEINVASTTWHNHLAYLVIIKDKGRIPAH